MRSKSLNTYFVSASFLLAASSFAAPTVEPLLPQVKVTGGNGEPAVYYPDTSLPGAYYLAPGFVQEDFVAGNTTNLQFTVSGVANNLMIFAEDTAGNAYPIPLFSCNGAPCVGAAYLGAGGATVTTGINPKAVCASTFGASLKGCAGGVADVVSSPIPGFKLRFVDTALTIPGSVTPTDRKAGTPLEIYPQIRGPVITACPGSPGFFPGDKSILVETGAFAVSVDPTKLSSPVFSVLRMVAEKTTLPADYTSASVVRTAGFGTGTAELDGFENSTDATGGIFYQVDYGIQDSAGVMSFCGQNPGGSNQTGYPIPQAFATDVQGFLRESNCFVATASFRNGRAPAVMVLREFRDEILAQTSLGRDFIGWYYANGPRAADWLIEHPVFRTISLSALIPLEVFAWVTLHPEVLWIPIGSLLVFLLTSFGAFSVRSRRKTVASIFVLGFLAFAISTHAEEAPPANGSGQPYIDSLISELPKETYERTYESPDPYVQKLKKNLGNEETSAGYADELKSKLGNDPSAGYTKRIQGTLPADRGSAIEDYRNGKKLRANKGDLTTASAFGFELAASANRTYTAGANQQVAYESVYGSGWIPDFKVHYEMRPFPRTGLLSKFGLYGSAGASFTEADGILDFDNNGQFAGRARTRFKFIMLPLNVGLIYRMNWGIFFPYFGAGPSAIGFIEQRNDKQPSQKGHNFGYWGIGGVALGLDWLSPDRSWDQYETATIKHSYFTIEYSYLSSLSGGLVDMTVDGLQLGFTFEL